MKLRLTSIALVCGCVALLAADRAWAQGSIGGTLGKTDKSSSGGEEQSPRNQKSGTRASPGSKPSSSVSGKWAWTARCDDATDWTGAFDMTQNSDGSVTGPFSGNGGGGSMTAKLSGNTLSGSLCYAVHCTQFTFTLGGSLEGSEKSATHGMCKYHGRRL